MGPRCRQRQPNLGMGSSRVSHACVMVIWPNKSSASEHLPQSAMTILHNNTTSCSIRGRGGTQLNKNSRVFVASVYGSVAIAYGSHDLLYTSYLLRLLIGSWQRSGPSSREIQNFIFVCPSGVNFGIVWRGHIRWHKMPSRFARCFCDQILIWTFTLSCVHLVSISGQCDDCINVTL